jgi:predicted dehydrogenase
MGDALNYIFNCEKEEQPMTEQINRRDFIKRAAVGSAGVSLAMSGASTGSVLGANDRIRLGLIGCGRQGVDNMRHFIWQGVEVAAVCDVYEPNLHKGLEAAGGKAKTVKDFRQVLDDKEIDAVIVATPDHWHALPTVMACQAGKDVYVEKPICVAVEEGKKMVEAARKYKRVVQVGLWQRSNLHFQKAAQLVQDGLIGKVSFVRTENYANIYPDGIGNPPDSDPPPELDWDMWLGPAPKVAFNWNRFGVGDRWSTFRYFYDYANGWPGDWGVHRLDIVQWALRVDGPHTITASGRKFYLNDNSDTPDTLQITLEYPDFVATYENRLCNESARDTHGYGIEIHGTDGTMFVDREGFQVFPEVTPAATHAREGILGKAVAKTPEMKMERVDDGLENHVANMLECMKTRKLPQSDIEFGHRSTSTCLLGNVALRSKERLEWDVASQRLIKGGPAAQKLLSREYRAPWKLVV